MYKLIKALHQKIMEIIPLCQINEQGGSTHNCSTTDSLNSHDTALTIQNMQNYIDNNPFEATHKPSQYWSKNLLFAWQAGQQCASDDHIPLFLPFSRQQHGLGDIL